MSGVASRQTGEHFTLAKPAIELAVAEVRFDSAIGAVSQELALAFRQKIRDSGFGMEQLEPVVTHEVDIQMGPEGGRAVGRAAAQGYVSRDAETGVAVTLMPTSVGVQTNGYVRWSQTMQPVIQTALAAVAELVGPTLRKRIGLRYINRFVDPARRAPSDWAGAFEPWLLGPTTEGALAPRIRSSQQQLELAWDDRTNGVLRHGAFLDPAASGACSYMLDIDISDTDTEVFDSAECSARITGLNRQAAELFRDVVRQEQLDERGFKVEVEEGRAE
jgi:uncharacterized protein (TIGR04255 family)